MTKLAATWDTEADVVVVGFGAAGVAASVTAHELGADVVIL
jgi:3-oxo-5alpha-steroid 4-dehydrogenase